MQVRFPSTLLYTEYHLTKPGNLSLYNMPQGLRRHEHRKCARTDAKLQHHLRVNEVEVLLYDPGGRHHHHLLLL